MLYNPYNELFDFSEVRIEYGKYDRQLNFTKNGVAVINHLGDHFSMSLHMAVKEILGGKRLFFGLGTPLNPAESLKNI
jgi:hypothetical protein